MTCFLGGLPFWLCTEGYFGRRRVGSRFFLVDVNGVSCKDKIGFSGEDV